MKLKFQNFILQDHALNISQWPHSTAVPRTRRVASYEQVGRDRFQISLELCDPNVVSLLLKIFHYLN